MEVNTNVDTLMARANLEGGQDGRCAEHLSLADQQEI